MSFILSGSKRPLSARAVECFAAGQREPPLAVLANEAAPLRPGQARACCFAWVYYYARVASRIYRMHVHVACGACYMPACACACMHAPACNCTCIYACAYGGTAVPMAGGAHRRWPKRRVLPQCRRDREGRLQPRLTGPQFTAGTVERGVGTVSVWFVGCAPVFFVRRWFAYYNPFIERCQFFALHGFSPAPRPLAPFIVAHTRHLTLSGFPMLC